jgi:hypothetical protein
MHLDSPGGKFLSNDVAGPVFLEAQFGMGVDVAADRLDFALKLDDALDQIHGLEKGWAAGRNVAYALAVQLRARSYRLSRMAAA